VGCVFDLFMSIHPHPHVYKLKMASHFLKCAIFKNVVVVV